jgi:hypothetical protein
MLRDFQVDCRRLAVYLTNPQAEHMQVLQLQYTLSSLEGVVSALKQQQQQQQQQQPLGNVMLRLQPLLPDDNDDDNDDDHDDVFNGQQDQDKQVIDIASDSSFARLAAALFVSIIHTVAVVGVAGC